MGCGERCGRSVSEKYAPKQVNHALGGVGGASPTRKTTGAAAVKMIPITSIYFAVRARPDDSARSLSPTGVWC